MRQQVTKMKKSMKNKVLSPNELIRQMHQAQRLETRAWTVLAVAASLVLGLSLLL